MRLDEFTLAGAQPAPVQRAVPAQSQGPDVSAPNEDFGQNIKTIVQNFSTMSNDDPAKGLISKFLELVQSASEVVQSGEQPTTEAIQTVAQARQSRPSNNSGAKSNNQFVDLANIAYTNGMIAEMEKIDPETAAKFRAFAAEAANRKAVNDRKEVKNAKKQAIAGIQLNTKGEIGALDADVEAMANEFVKRFGVKLVWARNIVGMFGQSIDRKDRQSFLQACLKGEALDIDKMLQMGEGSIDDCVTTKVPGVKEVYKSVKDTLLDISLSTGQRGATGPFEAMLAIMGGARKPDAGEGGDVKLPNGRKYEVKSTSLTPTSKLNSKGELPATGGGTGAWLDSTAGGEISGAVLRSKAEEWKETNFKSSSPTFIAAWKQMDFRDKGLEAFNTVLDIMGKKDKQAGKKLIAYMMSAVFPSITKAEGYNFAKAVISIEEGIRNSSPRDIAKIQGIMALLEYHLGKGNDGFIFFNSSVQEFKIFEGIEGILKLAKESGNVHFVSPMTMGKSQKCSPGLYYGPDPKSPVAKKYFQMFNSDPERVARRKAALEAEKAGNGAEDIRGFD
jgi:hypothetical protein